MQFLPLTPTLHNKQVYIKDKKYQRYLITKPKNKNYVEYFSFQYTIIMNMHPLRWMLKASLRVDFRELTLDYQ